MQRDEFDHAEAGFRRDFAGAKTPGDRGSILMLLSQNWAVQGREHEAAASAAHAVDLRDGTPEYDVYAAAGMLTASASLGDPAQVRRWYARWRDACAALPPGSGRPSSRSVHRHVFDAMLSQGRLADAESALDTIDLESAEPYVAERLAPVVAICRARLSLARGDPEAALRAADEIAGDPRADTRTHLDAALLAVRCSSDPSGGTGPDRLRERAARVVELLVRDERRLGSSVLLRATSAVFPHVTDPGAAPEPAARVRRIASDALRDRLVEIGRHSRDPHVVPPSWIEPETAAFRRRFASQNGPFLSWIHGDAPAAGAGSLCPSCLAVTGADGCRVPDGHLRPAGAVPAGSDCALCVAARPSSS